MTSLARIIAAPLLCDIHATDLDVRCGSGLCNVLSTGSPWLAWILLRLGLAEDKVDVRVPDYSNTQLGSRNVQA